MWPFDDIWEWFMTFAQGKRIAILGQRGTGKTCWYDYLNERRLHPTSQTITAERRDRLSVPEAGLRVKPGVDLPGGQRAQWRSAYEDADYIFYLLHAQKFRHDVDYQRSVREDAREIQTWKNERANMYILVTHIDTDPDRQKRGSNESYMANLTDEDGFLALRHRLSQTGADGKEMPVHILHGSLKTEDDAAKILQQFSRTVKG